jgi:hypothetical protein
VTLSLGTVTSASPLRVRLDGANKASAVVTFGPLPAVGTRVAVDRIGTRLVLLAGGPVIQHEHDTGYAEATAGAQTLVAGGFRTVDLPTVVAGSWSNSIYTVPASGTFLCEGKARLADNSTSRNMGIGVHTANQDGTWFAWRNAGAKRDTLTYTRLARFAKGDNLRMYIFSDGADASLSNASLALSRLGSG